MPAKLLNKLLRKKVRDMDMNLVFWIWSTRTQTKVLVLVLTHFIQYSYSYSCLVKYSYSYSGFVYSPQPWFHPTVYNGCSYSSMLRLKLNHVSKRGPWSLIIVKRDMMTIASISSVTHYICSWFIIFDWGNIVCSLWSTSTSKFTFWSLV